MTGHLVGDMVAACAKPTQVTGVTTAPRAPVGLVSLHPSALLAPRPFVGLVTRTGPPGASKSGRHANKPNGSDWCERQADDFAYGLPRKWLV